MYEFGKGLRYDETTETVYLTAPGGFSYKVTRKGWFYWFNGEWHMCPPVEELRVLAVGGLIFYIASVILKNGSFKNT